MDFEFSPEQDELRITARQFFAKHAAATQARAVGELDRPLWTRLTGELGLTALGIDESYGGFGASLVEVAIAVEEAGRVLLAAPYLSTVASAAALTFLARRTSPATAVVADVLAGIAAGNVRSTLGIAEPGVGYGLDRLATTARREGDGYRLDGVKEHVMDGDIADVIVVAAACAGEPGLFLVAADDPHREGMTTLDQSRPVARLVLRATPGIRVSASGDGGAAVASALDILHTLLAVESVGVAAASLELTTSYLNLREQFGVRLATFQALRHRVADLVVSIEAATSTAWYAVRTATDESGPQLPVVAPMAKLVAADAAYRATAESIQLHGGIGFTWEHPAHRFFKRATVNRLSYLDPVTLRRLIASRAGL